jgi:hypothetical protein
MIKLSFIFMPQYYRQHWNMRKMQLNNEKINQSEDLLNDFDI